MSAAKVNICLASLTHFSFTSRRSKLKYLIALILAVASYSNVCTADGTISVADEIRIEATKNSDDIEGHPLPLFSHWNSGVVPQAYGWSPAEQMKLIDDGHYLLPWFRFPDGTDEVLTGNRDTFTRYFKGPLERARDLHLPIVLVGSQWERFLSEQPYLSLPDEKNPNTVQKDGTIRPEVSPFGASEVWRDLGRRLTKSTWMAMLQDWYPDPPLVIFLSNNEHKKLNWQDISSTKASARLGLGDVDDNTKRKIVADGWIKLYRALQDGMRDGLSNKNWKNSARFVGYNAFGPPHIGRWAGWMDHSLYSPGRIDPFLFMWDGGSPSFYTDNWNGSTDFTVWSPQIEFMNLVFQNKQAESLNSKFWLELSIWDGYAPTEAIKDKRKFYKALGQAYSPERYSGMAQFGMWLLRPRAIREFRFRYQSFRDCRPYTMALIHAVDRIHTDPILRNWWRIGDLVPNKTGSHPYDQNIPAEISMEDRWFLLDVDTNPPLPWNTSTKIDVFALALTRHTSVSREWLVYAHSPLGNRRNVTIKVPGFGPFTASVTTNGTYYLLSEQGHTVSELK